MVNKKLLIQTALVIVVVLSVMLIMLNPTVAEAASIEYYLNHEYAKIWINTDGTIDLFYNITITCTQEEIRYVEVGQPNGDFTIGEAKDEYGHALDWSDVSRGDYYGVGGYLYNPISAGQSVRFTLLTNVGHMIWEDEDKHNKSMLTTKFHKSVSVSFHVKTKNLCYP